MPAGPRPFPPESLRHAAAGARLELTDDRLEEVGQLLTDTYALIDLIDDVPLGETPPATAFDARWEA